MQEEHNYSTGALITIINFIQLYTPRNLPYGRQCNIFVSTITTVIEEISI